MISSAGVSMVSSMVILLNVKPYLDGYFLSRDVGFAILIQVSLCRFNYVSAPIVTKVYYLVLFGV